MTAVAPWLVPLGVLVAALGLALAANGLALARGPRRDSGDLWAWVLVWSAGPLAAALVWARTLELFDALWWHQGYHPLFDLTGLPALGLGPADPGGAGGWPGPAWWWALAPPLALWVGLILVRLVWPSPVPGDTGPRPGSWLAGSLGSGGTRRWVLWALVPPLLPLILWGTPGLVGRTPPVGAATWGLLAVMAVSLTALALSRGRSRSPGAPPPAPSVLPDDWPTALRQGGLAVRTLCRLPPSREVPADLGPGAQALAAAWPLLTERRVASELIEVLAGLFGGGPPQDPAGWHRLILAPDDCGQWETLAVAIGLTRGLGRLTLVVTPGGPDAPEAFAERLADGLPDPGAIQVPEPGSPLAAGALAWVLGPDALSARLADLAEAPALLSRVGLVVWWDLDACSGVQAASLWALSRRLQRVLDHLGPGTWRSLAFVRGRPGPESNLAAFCASLLPQGGQPGPWSWSPDGGPAPSPSTSWSQARPWTRWPVGACPRVPRPRCPCWRPWGPPSRGAGPPAGVRPAHWT